MEMDPREREERRGSQEERKGAKNSLGGSSLAELHTEGVDDLVPHLPHFFPHFLPNLLQHLKTKSL